MQSLGPSSPEEAQKQGLTNIGSKEQPLYFDYTGVVGNLQKVGVSLSEKIIERIAKSGVADDIFKLLKGKATQVSDDILKGLSNDLVKVTDPKKVISYVDDYLKNAFLSKVKITPLSSQIESAGTKLWQELSSAQKAGSVTPGASKRCFKNWFICSRYLNFKKK